MHRTLNELLKHVDETDTKERHRRVIKAMADANYKDHVITAESENIFYCAKPGTGFYSFRVVFLPGGVILLYGDIGQLMLQPGAGFEWLKSAVKHNRVSDYVLEKTKPCIDWRTKMFLTGDAAAELREMHDGIPHVDAKGINFVEQAKEEGEPTNDDDWELKPNPELALKIAGEWLSYDETGQDADAWGRAYYYATGDCEYPDCRDYSTDVLYCYHALSWFVRKRSED